MFHSLRARFVLSHILPLLIILPLVGLLLIYILETQVLLGHLATELETQAMLVAYFAGESGDLWHNAIQAQSFVDEMQTQMQARIMLLGLDARLLSSSDPEDEERRGQSLKLDAWPAVTAGQNSVRTARPTSPEQEAVDILVPVRGPNRQLVGVVRLSYLVSSLRDRFLRHRLWIGGLVLGGLLLGIIGGLLLAGNLARPLQEVTEAVTELSDGRRSEPLEEQGPREMRWLVTAVNHLVDQLHSAEQARRKLLANLVHELGRPLGALLSAIQALRGGADQEVALRAELLAGMEQQVGRLLGLLDDLASLHDRTLGALELERRATDMNEWLTHTLGPWREAAQAKGLHWTADTSLPLPAIEIDPDRLAQALGNLLSNAVKYTPAGGSVSVDAGVQDQELYIRVRDTGTGIAPEELPRIFQPLYRAQVDRRFPQGMGLGLSIAHDLVVAHGGRLEVDSTLGQGSVFTLRIPLTISRTRPP